MAVSDDRVHEMLVEAAAAVGNVQTLVETLPITAAQRKLIGDQALKAWSGIDQADKAQHRGDAAGAIGDIQNQAEASLQNVVLQVRSGVDVGTITEAQAKPILDNVDTADGWLDKAVKLLEQAGLHLP